ncbi:PqqD family peptide modification chaperone [Chelatococcus sp. GCM10030263]|uniref:PqqD family peptide modification chaperone n=1 Tax=Chelatococcus sp. GCM10030263 TaxID=3273387 RepID=UPI003617CEAA
MPMEAGLGVQRVAIAEGASFSLAFGPGIVFSETSQKIFELNDTAAFIWCHLEDGHAPDAIVARLVDQGLAVPVASDYVSKTIADWHRRGLVLRGPTDVPKARPSLRSRLALCGLGIDIHYSSPALKEVVAPHFAHLTGDGGRPLLSLLVKRGGDGLSILRNGERILACTVEEIVPAIKAQLTTELLAHGTYDLALHAASLVRNTGLLLLSGAPGAGKSTLTVALSQAGFRYAGDDVALLNSAGCAFGVPFAPTLKEGAWKLLADRCPSLREAPIFRRYDGKRVRFLQSADLSPGAWLPVRWLVLLRRRSHAGAALEPMERVAAMRALLAGASSPDRRLSKVAFDALAQMMRGAECYCLTYNHLDEAVGLLRDTCR